MAFEKLDRYTEWLEGEYKVTNKLEFLYALAAYYETALLHAKFKCQRQNARAAMFRMNKAFAEGYFKQSS